MLLKCGGTSIPLTTNQAARGVTQGPLYEYACHEGNYSLVNVLSGARAEDRADEVTSIGVK